MKRSNSEREDLEYCLEIDNLEAAADEQFRSVEGHETAGAGNHLHYRLNVMRSGRSVAAHASIVARGASCVVASSSSSTSANGGHQSVATTRIQVARARSDSNS